MAQVKVGYLQRLWNAITGAADPKYIFGLEDADKLLSAPGVSAFVGGDGAVPVAIVATARFLGAKVTVAEEAAAYIQAQNNQIEAAEIGNQELQAELEEQIQALKAAKAVADDETKQTIAACVDGVQWAANVEQFFGPAL